MRSYRIILIDHLRQGVLREILSPHPAGSFMMEIEGITSAQAMAFFDLLESVGCCPEFHLSWVRNAQIGDMAQVRFMVHGNHPAAAEIARNPAVWIDRVIKAVLG